MPGKHIKQTRWKCRAAENRPGEWKATPFAPRPYYPFALGNGSECITIDYTGSMLSGYISGHAHKEQHQGLIPGWYKNAHRVYHIPARIARKAFFPSRTGVAQPCIQAGYVVMVNGENVEPSDFAQTFDARRGILTTDLTLHGGHWRVIAYLTDGHVWVEHVKALDLPRGQRVDLSFFINPLTYSSLRGLELARPAAVDIQPARDGALRLEYKLAPNEFRGRGMLWAAPRGKLDGNKIVYAGLKSGFSATRYLMLADEAEGAPESGSAAACYQRLRTQSERRIRGAHARAWLDYTGKSRVALPDAASQQLYDLSLYWIRANQYPGTGSLNLGPFPCHWGGGANAIWDASVMQIPLLHGNHLAESRGLLDYYRLRMPRGRAVAKALGLPGARFCFFASAVGQDCHADPKNIRKEKIVANATACLSFYDHWRISGRDDALPADLGLMRELLEHVLALAVLERDGRAYITDAAGAAEGRCPVSNDSFLAVTVARALRGCSEMAAAAGHPLPHYLETALKLQQGLRENVRNGVLMADRNSAQGGASPLQFICDLPGSLRAGYALKTLRYWMKNCGTPWGFDKPQKNYRDWPWCHCWLSTIYSHLGWDRRAFEELQLAMKDCSSLGAMPEKIRLDGYAINYWYTSSHAAYLQALQSALCHDRVDDALGLLWGMDGTWRDLEFDNLRMNGGLQVSLEAKNSRLRRLVLRNNGVRPVRRKLVLNPRYAGKLPEYVGIAAGETILL